MVPAAAAGWRPSAGPTKVIVPRSQATAPSRITSAEPSAAPRLGTSPASGTTVKPVMAPESGRVRSPPPIRASLPAPPSDTVAGGLCLPSAKRDDGGIGNHGAASRRTRCRSSYTGRPVNDRPDDGAIEHPHYAAEAFVPEPDRPTRV